MADRSGSEQRRRLAGAGALAAALCAAGGSAPSAAAPGGSTRALASLTTEPALSAAPADQVAAGPLDKHGEKAAGGEILLLPTFLGEEEFAVADADAARSDARRTAGPGAGAGPDAAFVATALVVLSGEQAAHILGAHGLDAAAYDGAPGFVVAHAKSIRAGAAAVRAVRGVAGGERAYLEVERPVGPRTLPTDPAVPQQWHLSNALRFGADLNVSPVWGRGLTGSGVTIGIVDAGISWDHPDLAPTLNLAASQSSGTRTGHGTSCAGLAAAAGNNGLGGAGVAYGARWSRLLYGGAPANAAAFAHRNDLNHVKSNSWGPPDDGSISYMSPAERTALASAATAGRGGRGVVFAWAAGNGGTADRVDYDPYASSRHAIAVSSYGDQDMAVPYAELSSCVLVCAPSDGNSRAIVAPDWSNSTGNGYTSQFGGTSASAPLAAGVVALMLQARPTLTVRDVQRVFVRTARVNSPADPSWTTNAAGRRVSERFGFGAIDADAAVRAAQQTGPSGPLLSEASPPMPVNLMLPDASTAGLVRTWTAAEPIRVEHVEVTINATSQNIGDVRIVLTSPGGAQSTLAATRSTDPGTGLFETTFTTVRHWDEDARGVWTLRLADEAIDRRTTWTDWRIVVHGTLLPASAADVVGIGGFPPPDGALTVDDYTSFINAFVSDELLADIVGIGGFPPPDNALTVDDYTSFINLFADGG